MCNYEKTQHKWDNRKSQQRNRGCKVELNGNFRTKKYSNWNKKLSGWTQWQNGEDKRNSVLEDRIETNQSEQLQREN